MNTEKLIVLEAKLGNGQMIYVSPNLGICGNRNSMIEKAADMNFNGGVEVYDPTTGDYEKL